jgi:hypothetical protein
MNLNELSPDRMNFDDSIAKSDIVKLIENTELKYLQTDVAKKRKTFELLDDKFFSKRPDVQLRMYGYYGSNCDLSLVEKLKNVEIFSADCLLEAGNVKSIVTLPKLRNLSVGIFRLDNFDFLNDLDENLNHLSLAATFSKKPKISNISKFKKIKPIIFGRSTKWYRFNF